ncbi:DUF6504 family protein [Deinococcus budaensis]|uniref:DUF6504 domain-containing protein n=1 Tax=Deinococcus budaensis TaxID=1665626 RepID=A0A7W8GEU8_9DEIO|nr:hypothetical protein [Deinococcus budaensis]
MRAIQQEVSVTIQQGGLPRQLYWQGRGHTVQVVLDTWRSGGRWWLDEPTRECYLVQAGPLVAELHHEDVPGGRWWLARVQD